MKDAVRLNTFNVVMSGIFQDAFAFRPWMSRILIMCSRFNTMFQCLKLPFVHGSRPNLLMDAFDVNPVILDVAQSH